MSNGEETKSTVVGTVEEVLPNSLFRVRLKVSESSENDVAGFAVGVAVLAAKPPSNLGVSPPSELVLAYLAGKMRLHRIRVLMGDDVEMILDPYGGRARIVRRLT